mgnify:CR=1 FL=1|jgi:micrococcal nuclease
MNQYKAKVIKVIDGDTIRLDIDLGFSIIMVNQTVRLFGIDTPESRTRDKKEKYYGNLSKDYVKKHCPKGSYITLHTTLDKKGKFGRILGSIFVDGKNLNKQMIKEHLAVEYYGQGKDEIEQKHLDNRKYFIANSL